MSLVVITTARLHDFGPPPTNGQPMLHHDRIIVRVYGLTRVTHRLFVNGRWESATLPTSRGAYRLDGADLWL